MLFRELLEIFLHLKAPRGGLGTPWRTPFVYRLDGQAALKRGLSFVIIVDSLFLIPDSLRQSLSSLLLHHSARFPRPSARFVLPSARFLIPDSYLPPPHIAQGALRRALCYISCLPPPASPLPIPDSLRQRLSSLLLHHSARFPRPSARFVLPSARFLIPDSYLPPPLIAQGALRRALCYISCFPPPDSCSPPPASYLPPCALYVLPRTS